MQARAILEAALDVGRTDGKPVRARNHDPAGGDASQEFDFWSRRASMRWRRRSSRRPGEARLPGRHDDRAAARGAAWPAKSRRRRSSSPSAPTISPRPPSASARRRGMLPRRLYGEGHLAARSLCVDRSRRRRRTRADRGRTRAQGARRSSSSASAASMAATRSRSLSATTRASTMCRARRSACRSRASPPPKPPSAKAPPARRRPRLARSCVRKCGPNGARRFCPW